MTREELIRQCRYYTGEDKNPFDRTDSISSTETDMAWFWDMERVYVKNGGEVFGEVDYYKAINGKKYKGIPYALLITMFTSWAKFTYDIKNEIGRFYALIDEYLFIANDHFPEDKIPPKGLH